MGLPRPGDSERRMGQALAGRVPRPVALLMTQARGTGAESCHGRPRQIYESAAGGPPDRSPSDSAAIHEVKRKERNRIPRQPTPGRVFVSRRPPSSGDWGGAPQAAKTPPSSAFTGTSRRRFHCRFLAAWEVFTEALPATVHNAAQRRRLQPRQAFQGSGAPRLVRPRPSGHLG